MVAGTGSGNCCGVTRAFHASSLRAHLGKYDEEINATNLNVKMEERKLCPIACTNKYSISYMLRVEATLVTHTGRDVS